MAAASETPGRSQASLQAMAGGCPPAPPLDYPGIPPDVSRARAWEDEAQTDGRICNSAFDCAEETDEDTTGPTRMTTGFRAHKVNKALTLHQALTGKCTDAALDEAIADQRSTMKRDEWVISPQFAPSIQWWDILSMTALMFVALVTPFEVALLETEVDSLMYLINRLIDCVFLIDMVLQFFLVYRVKTPYGYRFETSHRKIVRHYLKSWFALDFLSILPFDSIGLIAGSDAFSKAKSVKIMRLLRLIKISRVVRASRVFYRWETSMAINYNSLKLWLALIVFLTAAHWIACIWAMLGTGMRDGGDASWIDFSAPASGDVPQTAMQIYLTALYWSSMTVTSVGYGDVLPVNLTERIFCTLLMFSSGFLWAYVLGEFMSAIGNSNVHQTAFRQLLDDLNCMMCDHQLPIEMQRRLRAFFFQIKDVNRVRGYGSIVDQMSPSLQGELAIAVNEVWVRKVWYFDRAYDDLPGTFLAGLARKLELSVYTQQEHFGKPWTLYILHRGLCAQAQRLKNSGSVWGEDFILSCRALLNDPKALTLTFIEVAWLERGNLDGLVRSFPEVGLALRKAVVKIAVIRGVKVEARKRLKQKADDRAQEKLRLLEAELTDPAMMRLTGQNGKASPSSTSSPSRINFSSRRRFMEFDHAAKNSAGESEEATHWDYGPGEKGTEESRALSQKQDKLQRELDLTRIEMRTQLSEIQRQLATLISASTQNSPALAANGIEPPRIGHSHPPEGSPPPELHVHAMGINGEVKSDGARGSEGALDDSVNLPGDVNHDAGVIQ